MTKFRERIESILEQGHDNRPAAAPRTQPQPQPRPEVTADNRPDPMIDLRDAGLMAERALMALDAQWCPNCGGATRLDHIDDVARIALVGCLDCGLKFQRRLPQTLQSPTIEDWQVPVTPQGARTNRTTFF